MTDFAIDKFDKKRFGLITGSACSVLFPKKSAEVGQNTYAKKLALQKYFKYYDEVSTWQTEHGNFSEHEAFEYFQTHSDKTIQKGNFENFGEWGGTSDALGKDYGVDFKCPTSLSAFLNYLHDGIDEQQFNQAQMYMFLFKKPLWKVAIYLTETFRMSESGLTYPVAANKRMIIVDVPRVDEWEQKLRIVTPKIIDLREKYMKVLSEQFGENGAEIDQVWIDEAKQMLSEPPIDYSAKIQEGKTLMQKAGI